MSHLLEISGLQTHFPTRAGLVKAVNDVSFFLDEGELLGLVGESGCGKSITALSIMRLIYPPGRIAAGSIKFKGEELTTTTEDRMREIRGNDIAMIFQDPMTSLNPVLYGRRADRRSTSASSQARKERPHGQLRSRQCDEVSIPIPNAGFKTIHISFRAEFGNE